MTLLRGVTVPMVTPMDRPGHPSAARAERLLAALHASGVHGLMLLGSNGEGPLLPTAVLGEFVAEVADRWRALEPDGARPVLVNVSAAGTAEALARAEAVAPARPDALVLSPPSYFRHRDDEIVGHFAACARLGVPIVAYHIPRYGNPISPAAFEALLELDTVVGIKDSSGDPELLRRMVETARTRRPGFEISQGDERRLQAGLRLGADGIVPGIANLAPSLAVDLYEGRSERSQRTVDELLGIHAIRPGVPAVKAILDARGLCPPDVAPPLLPCTPAERKALLELLAPYESHLISPPGGRN
jgi:4-hydroxy-tetrahydrodipicolinate synthase